MYLRFRWLSFVKSEVAITLSASNARFAPCTSLPTVASGIAILAGFIFGARVVRILQDFAAICKERCCIFFVFRARTRTLDQHIGVRIPGGQPTLENCGFFDII